MLVTAKKEIANVDESPAKFETNWVEGEEKNSQLAQCVHRKVTYCNFLVRGWGIKRVVLVEWVKQ